MDFEQTAPIIISLIAGAFSLLSVGVQILKDRRKDTASAKKDEASAEAEKVDAASKLNKMAMEIADDYKARCEEAENKSDDYAIGVAMLSAQVRQLGGVPCWPFIQKKETEEDGKP